MNFEKLSDIEQEYYFEKAREILDDGDLMYCIRTWSAWSVGTMTQYDFKTASDDDDLVYNIAEKLYNIVFYKSRKYKIEKLLNNE